MTVWHINKLVTTITANVESTRVIILCSYNNGNNPFTRRLIVPLVPSDAGAGTDENDKNDAEPSREEHNGLSMDEEDTDEVTNGDQEPEPEIGEEKGLRIARENDLRKRIQESMRIEREEKEERLRREREERDRQSNISGEEETEYSSSEEVTPIPYNKPKKTKNSHASQQTQSKSRTRTTNHEELPEPKKLKMSATRDNFDLIPPKLSKSELLDQYYLDRRDFGEEEDEFMQPPIEDSIDSLAAKLSSTSKDITEDCEIRDVNSSVGKGLFATKRVSKGGFLPYYGIVQQMPKQLDADSVLMRFGDDYVINCDSHRSKAYYVNHGCEPNSRIELCTLADKSPAVVIMLVKDVDEDEEIITSYDWDVKDTQSSSSHVSLCLCSSTKCNLFMQRDAYDKLKLLIMNLKKVEINNITRVNAYNDRNNVLLSIQECRKSSNQDLSMLYYSIYKAFQSEFHVCDATAPKLPKCKQCVAVVYNTATNKTVQWSQTVSTWVSKRKTAGKLLYTINELLGENPTNSLRIYFDGYFKDISSVAILMNELFKNNKNQNDMILSKLGRHVQHLA